MKRAVTFLAALFVLSGCGPEPPTGSGGSAGSTSSSSSASAGGSGGAGGTGSVPACDSGKKTCGGSCVPEDIDHGCGGPGCEPCAFPHSTPICGHMGLCEIVYCDDGWRNCNGTNADGCEVHTDSDTNNCGACGNVCPNGKGCLAGTCTACVTAAQCDDGNPCTGDSCFDGICVHSEPPSGATCSVNGCDGSCLPSMANPDGGTIPPTCITPGC